MGIGNVGEGVVVVVGAVAGPQEFGARNAGMRRNVVMSGNDWIRKAVKQRTIVYFRVRLFACKILLWVALSLETAEQQ